MMNDWRDRPHTAENSIWPKAGAALIVAIGFSALSTWTYEGQVPAAQPVQPAVTQAAAQTAATQDAATTGPAQDSLPAAEPPQVTSAGADVAPKPVKVARMQHIAPQSHDGNAAPALPAATASEPEPAAAVTAAPNLVPDTAPAEPAGTTARDSGIADSEAIPAENAAAPQ